jgi:hypothetical protein
MVRIRYKPSGSGPSGRTVTAIGGVLLFLAALFPFSLSAAAEEIDRLVAAVNGVVITEGDLDLARNLNAILFPESTAASTSREEEIERQIDQELMRQELKNFDIAEEESRVNARMQSLRDAYAPKGGLVELLRRTGMQESELLSYIRLEISILRFVDFRFRPFIGISPEEIQAYYNDRLTPQLREAGVALPPLEQVSEKIRSILREEKINDVLDQWIKEIRRNSRIEYFYETK